MADNLITPEFRACFIAVFKATAGKNTDGTENAPKFSIRAAFPPNTDLTALKAQAKDVAEAKWGDKLKVEKFRDGLRSPFRTNDELDNPVVGIGDDWTIVTFSAKADRKPGLVDAKKNDIINEDDVYSGAWFRVQTHAYAYDKAGNKGVAFDLVNVQKLRDDETLGSGRMPANKAFDAVEGGEGKDAGSLFD